MPKSNFFTGQPIFSQLLDLIPHSLVTELARFYQADRYCKQFFTYDHLVSMLYAGFFHVSSLRELTTGLQANCRRLYHLGLRAAPRRSTLSDANSRRDSALFAALHQRLFQWYFPDSRRRKTAEKRLFIVDSTTITLFTNVMRGAGTQSANGRKKGGVKVHTLVDAKHDLPSFVRITEAKENDVTMLEHLSLPEGSIIVLDKGYISYKQFKQWEGKIIWVTRCKKDAHYQVVKHNVVNDESQKSGVRSDELILMGRKSNTTVTPQLNARLIKYFDAEKKRFFEFLTNDTDLLPEQIAMYYKRRWQIELLFKRIKQRYPLRYFLGDSANAIEIQIWCALICDLLIKIVKDQLQASKHRWSYANLAAMIKHHLMTYIKLFDFLKNPEKALLHYEPPNPQLGLWGASK